MVHIRKYIALLCFSSWQSVITRRGRFMGFKWSLRPPNKTVQEALQQILCWESHLWHQQIQHQIPSIFSDEGLDTNFPGHATCRQVGTPPHSPPTHTYNTHHRAFPYKHWNQLTHSRCGQRRCPQQHHTSRWACLRINFVSFFYCKRNVAEKLSPLLVISKADKNSDPNG